MEHAAGARALRQINAQNVEKDVKTAVLAVYLVIYIHCRPLIMSQKVTSR